MEVIVTFQERYCLPMYSRESLQEVFREAEDRDKTGFPRQIGKFCRRARL